jgi:transcriptional regulator of acetoin/glycerol metabolism
MVGRLLAKMIGDTRQEIVALVLDTLSRDLPADYAWPGNVRELEQATRRILLTHSYNGDTAVTGKADSIVTELAGMEEIDAQTLLATYCRRLYDRYGTFEEVARRIRLDRRTVKKYLQTVSKEAKTIIPAS